VTTIDDEYPAMLRDIHDPPLALYVKGKLQSRDRHAVAVVGTRHPTHYGRDTAETLGHGLAASGMTVVSGLAEGIDTAAHRGALKARGRTIAVLGGAMDCLYPPSNAGLAAQIEGQGAVVTEFPFGRQPDKTTFPMRNRIVSGMSMGVVVVEAGPSSGAMITADQALEQGRSVFAVPGRIDVQASRGCHELIKAGAKLVTGVEDILKEFEFLIPVRAAGAEPAPDLNADERKLLSALDEGERDVDTLIRLTGLTPASVNCLLLGLEMKRLVRVLPGRLVKRAGQRKVDRGGGGEGEG
jgi:DNA processing protein